MGANCASEAVADDAYRKMRFAKKSLIQRLVRWERAFPGMAEDLASLRVWLADKSLCNFEFFLCEYAKLLKGISGWAGKQWPVHYRRGVSGVPVEKEEGESEAEEVDSDEEVDLEDDVDEDDGDDESEDNVDPFGEDEEAA